MTKPIIGIGSDVLTVDGERERAFAYLTYTEALRRAGAVPVVIPPQPENAGDVVEGLDGILLAGGFDCDPSVYGEEVHPTVEPMDERRQTNDLALAKAARERGIPTLGVCLGMQVMNIAAGGTLVQDIPSAVDTDLGHSVPEPKDLACHDIAVLTGSRLATVLGPQIDAGCSCRVNSRHHQSVGRPGQGLTVSARASDGVVEAIEKPDAAFCIGVQWHPENFWKSGEFSPLFDAFVRAARERAG